MSGAASAAGPRSAEPLLAGAPRPRSLYVHVPFCARRCPYCDFSVSRSARPPVAEWVARLGDEAGAWFAAAGWTPPLPLDTIFVGGGTPSLLGEEGMAALAGRLRPWFTWGPDRVEWTAEANPGSLTRGVCEAWRAAGVNRVSLGVQSFDDRALAWLGRDHDAAEAVAAVRRARAAGLPNLNLDLIFGLPAEVPRRWEAEVERAIELGAEHVSAYGLTAEPRTPLGRRVELGRARVAGEDRYEEEYLAASSRLPAAGYAHYEVSNFALPGRECAHNWHYWDGSAYLGLGPSAHSFLPPFRIWNAYRWDAYRKAAPGGGAREGFERPGAEETALERVWLGLRTRAGLPADDPAWRAAVRSGRAERWRSRGWVEPAGRGVRLTAAGWLRVDGLAAELAAAATPGDGNGTGVGNGTDAGSGRER